MRFVWIGSMLAGLAAAAVASANPQARIAVGAGAGSPPRVVVYDADTPTFDFLAYGASFFGGVRVALGDLSGDGVADIVTAPAAGTGQRVKIYDGVSGIESGGFYPFDIFHSAGIFVAAGDVNGDGRADVVAGSDADASPNGGPRVKVYDGVTRTAIADFNAFEPSFRGGVRVATGDVNGDGLADVVVGSGPGGGGHVKIYSGMDQAPLADFFAYGPSFSGGVFVAAGDVDGDGRAETLVSPDENSNGVWTLYLYDVVIATSEPQPIASIEPYPGFTGGVRVGIGALADVDALADILFGPGPTPPPSTPLFAAAGEEPPGPILRRMRGYDQADLGDLEVFDASFTGGVFVAVSSVPEPEDGAALAAVLCLALRSRWRGRSAHR